jgi:hypothetical protein
MRSLSAYNTTATDSPYCAPIWLVEIDFGSLTLYLCSAEFGSGATFCTFNSQLYEPVLLSVGTIGGAKIDPKYHKTTPGTFSFTVDNSVGIGGADCFSALFPSNTPQFAAVSVDLIFDGATAAGDKIALFSGKVDGMPELSQQKVTVSCSSYEMELSSLFPAEFCDVDTFSDADPDDVGKMFPYVWGSARRVPFLAVKAGAVSPLVAYISSSATTLYISDTTGFPSSGTVQIGTEQMTYSGLNTSTGAMTGLSRGANSTDAAEHSAGDYVGVVLTEFIYCIGHAVKAINAVYIGDKMVDSGDYTAYTGQTGDQLAGYGTRACIKFTAVPWIEKQYTISVSDDLDIDDDKEITVDGSTRDLIPNGGQANCRDGNSDTYYTVTQGSWQDIATFPTTDYGEISRAFVHLIAEFNGASGELDIQVDGDTIGSITTANGGNKQEYRFEWDDVGVADWGVTIKAQCDTVGETGKIYEIWWSFEYAPSTTTTGAVTLTGGVTGGNSVADTVVGGIVSSDVEGYQDDGSGTITGTPAALIERPDHVLEHILTVALGLSGVIDSTSYTAAGTDYDTSSYALGVAVLQQPDVMDLINRIAHQARSIEFWSAGTHHLIPIDLESSDKTIAAQELDINQTKLSYTLRADVRNDFSGRYSRDWSGHSDNETADRAMVTDSDSTSDTAYGTRTSEQQAYPYVTTSAQAQDVLTQTMYRLRQPRRKIQVTGGFGLTALEIGDVVDFDFTAGDELDNALLGLVETTDAWRVIEKQELNTGALLRMIEVPAVLEWDERVATTYEPPVADIDSYEISFTGGNGPYTWTIDTTASTGISLEHTGSGDTTATPINTLYISSAAEGTAQITITDAEGNEQTHQIMSTEGQWVQKTAYDDTCVIHNAGELYSEPSYWSKKYRYTVDNRRQEADIWLSYVNGYETCEDPSLPVGGCAAAGTPCHGQSHAETLNDCLYTYLVPCVQTDENYFSCYCQEELRYFEWEKT